MPRKKKWVEQLLTKREAIERAVGMPLGNMLGCGHWGCVFESTPPWVVKLSIDPTEGPIWSKIAGLVQEEQWGLQGFTEIKSIHRLTPDLTVGGRERKVWAIVRENVEPVFKEYRPKELGHHGGGLILRTSPYTTQALGEDAPVSPWTMKQSPGLPTDFARAMEGLAKYRTLTTEWHARRHPSRRGPGPALSISTSLENAEYRINRIVETMFNGPAMAPLGESLNMLASHGIYLRDVHLLNIGWHIAHDEDDWDRVVIFDPGHTPTESVSGIEEALVENGREAL